MIAEQLINYMVPPLKPNDDIARAKQWMDEFRVKELPVVNGSQLLGFVSEELLYDEEIMHPEVGAYPLMGQTCIVPSNSHYYDILKVQNEHRMDMVAVIKDQQFKGVVLISDILREFAKTAIVNAEGAIVTLQTSLNDYSLSEISRVVEMNGSTILGANIKPDLDDPALIEIVLRINHQDVNQIATGLSKSGYKVTSSFNTEDNSFDEKDRYGMLMKFLDP
ncbi:CBS domain-containing protein [Ekhidna lutea]|uniref:CBS domain-containing protein n=1 Tax=Ekhidna lutea TaxID=447679 RepID=A0A239F3B5_EKHLU|nr:CBS domain-containing protein [Ekhidna lutea]SNS50662.1 CBS domain-containing protein [Ekhidna lutea]